ncbi:DNA-binding transcriptional activator PunR [Vibrio nigripulchritudo]|uniref:DNA-binding transcriptional activator PunR n=1 Tax=Vibrio nigripulchritudo TaxID=28173 RepID=UPI00248F8EC1|nr:DNA-binding transcriptional activator PunR [Vibrio nigripulchritudo]BDU39045.1 LysR family transcriptional regulator [Vibrio nigripulchritudo]BDU44765.1 LysR family transcriptional regulator [Vibrio nigripulchritudo]
MFSKQSLEMLDTVARMGSFSAAAERLHKVPSAISYSVRQIEQEMGVLLFRRLPRKVELTPAGETFIQHARQMLIQMEDVRAQTRRAALGWHQTLKLTLDNVVKLDKLKPLIEDFYQTFDFAELQINMEVFNGSWEAISQERADIVLGATAAVPVGGDFGIRPMGDLEWVFVMSPAHPCVLAESLCEETVSPFLAICLDDTSIVLPKRHNWHYRQQRRILLPNWFSAIECLKNGVGVGYMPKHIASGYLARGELIEREIETSENSPMSACCMVWRQNEDHRLRDWMINYLGNTDTLYRDWIES